MTPVLSTPESIRFTPAGAGGKGKFRKALSGLLPVAALVLTFGIDHAEAARPCKSDAYDKADAEAFCEGKLQCSKKTPPQTISCRGNVRRWICRCTTPKPPSPQPQGSLGPGQGSAPSIEKDPLALLNALAAALDGLEGREQTEVVTPTGRDQVPSALAAAQGAVRERQDQLIRAEILDRERKRDREARRQRDQREHARARETGSDSGTFEGGGLRESADATGLFEGDGLRESADATGTFEGDVRRETGDSTGIFEARTDREGGREYRETGDSTGIFEARTGREGGREYRETGDDTGIF
jgi:hypothetical protein